MYLALPRLARCCGLFVAAVLIECWKSQVLYAMKRKIVSGPLFVAAFLIESVENLEFRTPWRENRQFASRTWMEIVSRHLFVAAVLIKCWKSRVPYEINLVSFDWLRIGAGHLLILTYLLTHLLNINTIA